MDPRMYLFVLMEHAYSLNESYVTRARAKVYGRLQPL